MTNHCGDLQEIQGFILMYSAECEILAKKNQILENLVTEAEARNKDLKNQIIAKRTLIVALIKDMERWCNI